MVVQFKSPYQGKIVIGVIDQSVTFDWRFSGRVDDVIWALKRHNVNLVDKRNGLLSALDRRGIDLVSPGSVPDAYRGRVNGNRTDDSSSGLASFTLHNLTKDHERIYGCELSPDEPNQAPVIDLVQLLPVGMYLRGRAPALRMRF